MKFLFSSLFNHSSYETNNKTDFTFSSCTSILNICFTNYLKHLSKYRYKNHLSFLLVIFSFYGVSLGQNIEMNSSKYLLTPSAHQLPKGSVIYQKINLYINSIEIGFSDNFSLEAGQGSWYQYQERFDIQNVLIGFDNFSIYANPKFSIQVQEDLRIAGGTFFAYSSAFENQLGESNVLFCPYMIATQGSKDHNISGGIAWNTSEILLLSDNNNIDQLPYLTFSGISRISKNFALVTENFFIPKEDFTAVFSYGLRFISKSIEMNLAFKKNPNASYEILGLQTGKFYSDISIKF